MRICRKCSKLVKEESQICRECGGILEAVPDEELSRENVRPESPREASVPSPAEPQAHEPGRADQMFVAEVVSSEGETAGLADDEAPPWDCPQCGEAVPGTFDMCWKCLTTKEGQKADQSDIELLQRVSEASKADQEVHSTHLYPGAPGTQECDEKPPPGTECFRCGSATIMRGVTVGDQGEYSDGRFKVVVCGDPAALIFKDRLYGELRADICGHCGHVELRVANPKQLYQHYQKSLD